MHVFGRRYDSSTLYFDFIRNIIVVTHTVTQAQISCSTSTSASLGDKQYKK